jgi:hypothetical protein
VPIRSGATLECKDRLYLEAKVDVVRIVVNNGNGFGVGCRISEYRVLANDNFQKWATAKAGETVSAATTIEQLV